MLENNLKIAWSPKVLTNLIDGMPERVRKCIKLKSEYIYRDVVNGPAGPAGSPVYLLLYLASVMNGTLLFVAGPPQVQAGATGYATEYIGK